ncbi:membrane protein, conserved [Thermococcus sp. 4557]|uniref:membrane protein n=1 Tax=Thermococcus sp. (strain CGMCC 1.5172 / 4557) TaxID=1042877 RepID=UPI000219EED2|nr:membrane protein [Thermococcus sp. 4557]AEK72470.1 membrane protein, conserved [Thermococcus sp. 4557]
MEIGAIIGLIGMLLLVGSWVPQTVETLRTKHCPLNLEFIIIYVAAASMLTVYSYIIGDWIFFTLNFLSAFQSAVNLAVKLIEK